MNFQGKVALITGSSDGIGAATALLLSSLGAKVAIVGRNQTKLAKVAAECEAKSPHGFKPVVIQADFEEDEEVKRTFETTIGAFRQLDILINNVGLACRTPFEGDNILEDYDRVMQVNVRSIILLTRLAKDHLKQAKGAIVNVSSIAGVRPLPSAWSYSMSKAALDMFTRSIAGILGPHVRVNSVNPGPVRTSFLRENENANQFWSNYAQRTALERIGDPEDIAHTIAFLASDLNKNMTGSIVISDSGTLVPKQ